VAWDRWRSLTERIDDNQRASGAGVPPVSANRSPQREVTVPTPPQARHATAGRYGPGRLRHATGIAASVALSVTALLGSAAPDRFGPADHYRIRAVEDPQWSPDGRAIAFVQRINDAAANRTRSAVWVVQADGANPRRLTPEPADDTQPRWSPDGRTLAVLTSIDEKPAVAVMAPDGSARRRLAFYDASNDPLAYQGVGEQIAWAPDSLALAFLSADPGPEPSGSDPYVITRLGYKSWSEMNDTAAGTSAWCRWPRAR
jgi:hypothetical protein